MKAQTILQALQVNYPRKPRALAALGGLVLAVNFGCTDHLPVEASFDLLEPTMTVTGADPAEGEQGETLVVRVFGTGFENDVIPAWERNGVVDTRIGVGQVIVVSSNELRATISIAPDAGLGIRDISVSGRKKGIGSESPRAVGEELFVVNEYTPQALPHLATGLWRATGFSYANAINSSGVIVGRSDGVSTVASGFGSFPVSWSAGAGAMALTAERGSAAGINNSGWIVGGRNVIDQFNAHPFLLRNGVVTALPPLEWPYESVAMAVNDAGTIVGYGARDPHRDPTWPVVWQPLTGMRSSDSPDQQSEYGPAIPLPLRPGEEWAIGEYWEGSSAMAINARGDVVGTLQLVSTTTSFLNEVAVLWIARPDGSHELPVVLGVLGNGKESAAISINDAGWVVGTLGGWYEPMRAVLWHPNNYDVPILLPVEPGTESSADGINNNGEIVGFQRRGPSDKGILWTVDSNGTPVKSTLLRATAGYSSSMAFGINDAGWIVGLSSGSSGWEATLWRPDM